MHEWSLAEGIIATISDECSRLSVDSVSDVDLSVGELAQIELPVLREALRSLKKGTVMSGCRIHISQEKTAFRCRKCGRNWSFSDSRKELEPLGDGGDNAVHYIPSSINAFISCPSCGSPDFDISSGFGLRISRFKPGGRRI